MDIGQKSLGEDEADDLGKGETLPKRQHSGNDPCRIEIRKITANLGAN